MPSVTIYELSMSYQQTAAGLRARAKELESASREEIDTVKRQALLNRARSIRSMYRDVRGVAQYLANYYPRRAKR